MAAGLRILLAAGEDSTASFARLILASLGHSVTTIPPGPSLSSAFADPGADIGIIDFDALGSVPLGPLLERIARDSPQTLVLGWCEDPSRIPPVAQPHIHAMLARREVRDRLITSFSTLLERFRLRERLRESLDRIVGHSHAVRQLYRLVEKASAANGPVLITGESGTGKELVARAIAASHLRFVVVNCSAIPESLFESELFGHVRGSFTGASTDRTGLFEEASGGSLFLDEIGDLPSGMQTKLLRALQEGEIRPVGSNLTRKVQVRAIAATNRTLEDEIRAGRFREDLFFRLNVIPVHIPPLRERMGDLPDLVQHFLRLYGGPGEMPRLTSEAWKTLEAWHWPGNIRELENVIHRATSLMEERRITVHEIQLPHSGASRWSGMDYAAFRSHQEGLEKEFIASRLREYGGSVTRTAEALGIGRTQLHNRASRLGLNLRGLRKSQSS